MKILSYKHLTYSEVVKLLKKLVDSGEGVSSMMMRVYEYVTRMNKCDRGDEIVSKLIDMGFKEVTAVMLVNNCPKSLDEVRVMLNFEDRTPDTDVLEKVLEILGSCCTS